MSVMTLKKCKLNQLQGGSAAQQGEIQMIKDFENYTKKQKLGNNSTQWEKKYPDGGTATVVVDNVGITRKMVREAFQAQESGVDIPCFQKSDVGRWIQ
ncbi:hypothetical protein M3894_002922 [Vibrio metschnikovii]|nr:hypothetical protein [Vibrio metschnikovii]